MNLNERDKMEYIRISTTAGGVVGYYNRDEWGDACEMLNGSDRVEIYDDNGDWSETMTGTEFKRLYGGDNE